MRKVIAKFDDLFQQIGGAADAAVKPLLREVHDAYAAHPADPLRARNALLSLFEYLVSARGRTHANCSAVDRFLMEDPTLTKGTGLPAEFVEFLLNANCLHDAIESAEIAENFDSTPEQLLEKARSLPTGGVRG